MSAANGQSAESGGLTFRNIASIVMPWRWRLLLVAIFVLLGAGLDLVPPLVMGRIIDDYLKAGAMDGLLGMAALYLAATGGVNLTGFGASYFTAVAAQGAIRVLRVRLFQRFQELPLSYFDRTSLGEIISRCTSDVETLDTLFSSGVVKLLSDLVRLATTSAAMIALSPRLSLISALAVPPLVLATRYFKVRIRVAERAYRRAIGGLNARLQETLLNAEVINAFARDEIFVWRFRRALRDTLAAGVRAISQNMPFSPLMAVLSATVIALLLGFGATPAFVQAEATIGTLTAFILLFQRFFSPVISLGEDWQTVQSALAGAERIFEVLSIPVAERSDPSVGAENGRAETGRGIVLRDVTFGYLDEPVLSRVSISVAPGEHVALVGRTGAGKSSIVNLIGGLYQPWEGAVRVDGADPASLEDDDRRRRIGAVPQTVQLFGGTVLDNLRMGDASVPRPLVENASRMAGADAFIRSLPQGYDTWLSGLGRGEGAQLSAGQRQLLALARALVWDPKALLLDEATAAVDSASEVAMREALRAGSQDKAVLIVAHRLSTACAADRVVLLERGRVVEEGTPDELVAMAGRFAALLELEAAGWDWRAMPA